MNKPQQKAQQLNHASSAIPFYNLKQTGQNEKIDKA